LSLESHDQSSSKEEKVELTLPRLAEPIPLKGETDDGDERYVLKHEMFWRGLGMRFLERLTLFEVPISESRAWLLIPLDA